METKYVTVLERLTLISSSRIIFDDGTLVIEGISKSGAVAAYVRFDNVLVTRISDEGARLRLLNTLGEATSAFVVEAIDSELLQWVAEEGLQTRDLRLARHHLVFTGEEVTDVMTH